MSTTSPPPSLIENGNGDAQFGKFVIRADCIFYRSSASLAFVNLRPIVPGHVLVVSRRVVPRLRDLTEDEYVDLWKTVRVVQGILLEHQQSSSTTTDSSFNVSVQDGRGAGQSVPHVHVHILPRVTGDFAQNDEIYQALEEWVPRVSSSDPAAHSTTRLEVPDDDQRRDRTPQEMAEEAETYRRIVICRDE